MNGSTYTLTIYVAAPGTPLNEGHENTSLPGHMFYVIGDDISRYSFGFAPIEHGTMNGPGKSFDNDEWNYIDPHYSRTLEITADQFDRLKSFGENPARFGFDTMYRDARNNCVDFTWAALHRAGLHPVSSDGRERTDFEGNLRPTRNIEPIQSIRPPVPDSLFNTETVNPLPHKQTMLQRALTEQQPAFQKSSLDQDSSIDDLFDALYGAALAKDHVTERAVGQAYAQTDAGRALFAEASLVNQRQDLREQQQAFDMQRAEAERSVAPQRGHGMAM